MINTNEKKLNTIRWVARIWSLLPVVFALGHLFEDDTNIVSEILFTDYMLLSLLAIYVIGLVIAWKWDLIGGLISAITFLVFIVLFAIFVDANFMAYVVFLLGAFPPALLFAYYGWSKKKQTDD